MSIEKITSKIIDDAKLEADEILKENKEKCDLMIKEAKEKATQILESQKQNGESEKEKIIERRRAASEIDGKKILLLEKQKLIDEVIEKAVQSVVSKDRSEYLAFVVNGIKKTGKTEGEIILNKRDKEDVGSELIGELKEAGFEFALSEETRDIAGGFILKDGSIFINGSVDNIIDEKRDELALEIATILF